MERFEAKDASDYASLADKGPRNVDAVVFLADAVSFNARAHVIEFAVKYRLPAIYQERNWVEAGGLMSYGINESEIDARVAELINKILRGTTPADLPVEQPTKFDLVINLKTAKALGLTIPPSLLAASGPARPRPRWRAASGTPSSERPRAWR